MSSSLDKEDNNVGDTNHSDRDKEDKADSAEELIAKVDTKCKTLIHDQFPKQDVAGPQLSKEGVKEAMKGREQSGSTRSSQT